MNCVSSGSSVSGDVAIQRLMTLANCHDYTFACLTPEAIAPDRPRGGRETRSTRRVKKLVPFNREGKETSSRTIEKERDLVRYNREGKEISSPTIGKEKKFRLLQ